MDTKRRKISDRSSSSNGGGTDVHTVPIRTLCIADIKSDMTEQIKMYFKRFGTVNSVQIHQKDDTYHGLVEFKSVEAAAAVLTSNGMHCIEGCNVQVKAAEPWQQSDHILALDDKCLRAILLHLNLADLASAANVCVRFNEQAKSVFSTKFEDKLALTGDKYEAAVASLQTFGSLAQSVNFHGFSSVLDIYTERYDQIGTKFLSMVNQCCTSQLKEVKFCKFFFDRNLPSDVKFDSAWTTIETLSFRFCTLEISFNALLSACTKLKKLEISDCDLTNVEQWELDVTMSELEELRLVDDGKISDRFINNIIRSGPKLKKISVLDHFGSNAGSITRTIVQNCPNLLELELKMQGCTESVHNMQQLTSLKILKLVLSCGLTVPLSTLLTSNPAPIEHLKLTYGGVDDATIKAISQMKYLKVLELSRIVGFTAEHMIELARGLGSTLENLQLEGPTYCGCLTTIGLKNMLIYTTKLSVLKVNSKTITIDADDYNEMLHTLQKRPEKIKLLLELTGRGDQVHVVEHVQKENLDWFQIDEKVYLDFRMRPHSPIEINPDDSDESDY